MSQSCDVSAAVMYQHLQCIKVAMYRSCNGSKLQWLKLKCISSCKVSKLKCNKDAMQCIKSEIHCIASLIHFSFDNLKYINAGMYQRCNVSQLQCKMQCVTAALY